MATPTKPAKSAAKPLKSKVSAPKAAAKPEVKPVAKPAAKAASTQKPAVAKPAVKKPAAKPAPAVKIPVLTPEQRRCYVEVAAYYIAEQRGFDGGGQLDDWAQAEAKIDRLLREGILKP